MADIDDGSASSRPARRSTPPTPTTVVGSGRVGRTRTLSVDERAALAARAYIRHHYTDYEAQLDEASRLVGDDIDGGEYREIKRVAHDSVEAFLSAHRKRDTASGTTT